MARRGLAHLCAAASWAIPSHEAFLLRAFTREWKGRKPGLGFKGWRQLNSRGLVTRTAEWRSVLGVILAYALITVVVTCPVAFRLRSALAGTPDQDALQHLWISWWTEKALLELGTSPAQASCLYYPDGTYNPMLWVTPYPQVAALPLQLLFGQVVAYNLHLLLSFVLTGLTTYLLCLYLTRNRWASFIGGLIFAFFPNRLSHATAHLAQVVTYFFPLYALYLIRLFAPLSQVGSGAPNPPGATPGCVASCWRSPCWSTLFTLLISSSLSRFCSSSTTLSRLI
jgi:hypothetical protein